MPNSGKWLALGIIALAIALAGASWWFRYEATHRAAEFWGPDTAVLIRDAPKVALFQSPDSETIALVRDNPARAIFGDTACNISQARGLLHLRNALLEDRNFIWPAADGQAPHHPSDMGYWLLSFYDPQHDRSAVVMFSKDCRRASGQRKRLLASDVTTISTEPIAAGLREMFAEFTAECRSAPPPSR